MSFDINVEGLLMPNKAFSPFVFAGAGLNASNYFKQSDIKTQMGFGLEYIVTESIGVKLFTDYNYVFSDLVDGKESETPKSNFNLLKPEDMSFNNNNLFNIFRKAA